MRRRVHLSWKAFGLGWMAYCGYVRHQHQSAGRWTRTTDARRVTCKRCRPMARAVLAEARPPVASPEEKL
jgi:hypothetical protein